jgi:cytoskeletal protein CcmA (bactofilin family)
VDPLATAKRASAQAEVDARETLQREYTTGLRVPANVAAARDDLGRELAQREVAREAEVRARLKQSQDEQAALARELAELEAAAAEPRVAKPAPSALPVARVPRPAAPTSPVANANSVAAAARARQEQIVRENAARDQAAREAAERDAKLATMPKHLGPDLAAAVLGLAGSEKFWGNVIIAQAQLQGSVKSGSALRIDGVIDGACEAPVLMISEGALVTGTVAAENIVIFGTVQGTIVARNVTIAASAKVEGDLYYQSLALDEAAQCDLRLSRLPAGSDPMTAAATVARPDVARAA